jgi:hypothetical protein
VPMDTLETPGKTLWRCDEPRIGILNSMTMGSIGSEFEES